MWSQMSHHHDQHQTDNKSIQKILLHQWPEFVLVKRLFGLDTVWWCEDDSWKYVVQWFAIGLTCVNWVFISLSCYHALVFHLFSDWVRQNGGHVVCAAEVGLQDSQDCPASQIATSLHLSGQRHRIPVA